MHRFRSRFQFWSLTRKTTTDFETKMQSTGQKSEQRWHAIHRFKPTRLSCSVWLFRCEHEVDGAPNTSPNNLVKVHACCWSSLMRMAKSGKISSESAWRQVPGSCAGRILTDSRSHVGLRMFAKCWNRKKRGQFQIREAVLDEKSRRNSQNGQNYSSLCRLS